MAFLRLFGATLFVLSVVYVCLFVQLRKARHRQLSEEAESLADGPSRAAFVENSLAAYTSRLWRWLIVLVYVLPIGGFAAAIYVSNIM